MEILRPGLTQLEDLTGKPVVGVVPYGHFDIDDEDSLSERLDAKAAPGAGKHCGCKAAATVQFHRFLRTFACIGRERRAMRDKPAQLGGADLIILPGTKSTLADLQVAARERHGGRRFSKRTRQARRFSASAAATR